VTRAAVLDLGSSSFQLMVCQTGPAQSLRPVLKRQSLLNLGLEVGSKGIISPERVRAAMAAVKSLRKALNRASPDVVVPLATAALRDAANGHQVVERLEHVLGAPIRLLQGAEEARLCFIGQRAGVYVGEDPTLGIDLGGGSFELAVGNCYEIYVATSAPVGATRLKGELGTGEILSREDRKEVRERAREAIEAMRPELGDYPRVASRTVVSGGTARALARLAIARGRRPGGPGWGVNQVEVSAAQLGELAGMLAHLDLAHRLALPGMPARRAAVLPLGACVLQAIAEELGIDHYVVSEWGLREGAVIDALDGSGRRGWRLDEDLFVSH
jgi:exopolyphosphatase / guanosine-5'-triphosphate,3'-diphosphate pyrophosphatase